MLEVRGPGTYSKPGHPSKSAKQMARKKKGTSHKSRRK